MTLKPVAIVLSSLLLGGCYVRLPISEAVAQPISDEEAATMPERLARPPVPGKWFRVRVVLPRESVRKIARWELSTHFYVEGCTTRELVGVASSVEIEGTDGDFGHIRQLLRDDAATQKFIMNEPVFMQAGKKPDRLCLRIDGGSYTLQKISTDPVSLRLRREAL